MSIFQLFEAGFMAAAIASGSVHPVKPPVVHHQPLVLQQFMKKPSAVVTRQARLPTPRPHLASVPSVQAPVVTFAPYPFDWHDKYSRLYRDRFGNYNSLGPAWLQQLRYRV